MRNPIFKWCFVHFSPALQTCIPFSVLFSYRKCSKTSANDDDGDTASCELNWPGWEVQLMNSSITLSNNACHRYTNNTSLLIYF